MVKSHIGISTISHDYGEDKPSKAKTSFHTSEPLHIERPTVEPIPHILKGPSKYLTYNPNVRPAHNFSLVEDLAQSPYAMSMLEVLQSCPT